MLKKPYVFLLLLNIIFVLSTESKIIKKTHKHSKNNSNSSLNSPKTSFVLGKNISHGANFAATSRFKSSSKFKDDVSGNSNPTFINSLQYTTDGRECNSGCTPHESGDYDECEVKGENTKSECVKIANVNDMRPLWKASRIAALVEYTAAMNEVEAMLPQFEPQQGSHDHVYEERKRYLLVVEEIKMIKLNIDTIIKTLNADADNLDQLKIDLSALKVTYNQLKIENKDPPADCTGLPGQEKENEGDGLNALWYNNVYWKGDPFKTVAKEIDYFLIDEAPVPEVNGNNFSVEFKGQIVVPKNGQYTFFCDSDDGCKVKIGAGEILNDNCEATDDYLKTSMDLMEAAIGAGEWSRFVKPEGPNDPPKFPRNNKSEPVDLKAGEFAEISISAFHSVHNSLYESGHAWIKFQQESDDIRKTLVPTSSLYSRMMEDQLKAYEQNAMELMLDKVAELDNAFIGNDEWKMKFVNPLFVSSMMLKAKINYNDKELKFMVNKPIILYLGQDAENNYPLPAEFIPDKKLKMALEKLTTGIQDDLEMGKIVPAPEEIVMKFAHMEFDAGEVNVALSFENAMKIIIIIIAQTPPDKSSCAGEAIKVSDANLGFAVKCDPEGTASDNDCDMAFADQSQWKSKDTPSLISQEYNQVLLPKKVIYKPDPASGKWPMFVTIHQNDKASEKLKVQAEENEFILADSVETAKVTFEIDKGEAGGQFEVWAVPCENLTQIEKDVEKAAMEEQGVEPVIPSSDADCDTKYEQMTADSMRIACKATCGPKDEHGNPTFEKNQAGTAYLRTSSVCAAAADAYASDPAALEEKKFGLVKVTDPLDTKNFFIGFDTALTTEDKSGFKKGDLVDVMTEQCFSRGEIESVNGDIVSVIANSETVKVNIDSVFKCGYNLPEPCGKLSTKNIKIKFCRGGGALVECKNKLKEWQFFDVGGELSDEYSEGKYKQGWNAKNEDRMLVIPKLDQANETSTFENTVALIDENIPGEWSIKLINRFYHVIIQLHYASSDEKGAEAVAAMAEFELEVNKETITGSFTQLSEIFRVDIPKLKVDVEEIRIKRVKGRISMLAIDILPIPDDAVAATKEQVAGAKTKTFIGCPMKDDVLNCAYNEKDVSLVSGCKGMFKKLGQDDDPKVRCLMKCTDDDGTTPVPEPTPTALPDPVVGDEEEAKPLVSPVTKQYWCMVAGQAPDTVFYFESDIKYFVWGRLQHLYDKKQGDFVVDGNWVDITFFEPVDKTEHTQFFYRHNDNLFSMSKNDNCEEGEECELMNLQKMTKEEEAKFKETKSQMG